MDQGIWGALFASCDTTASALVKHIRGSKNFSFGNGVDKKVRARILWRITSALRPMSVTKCSVETRSKRTLNGPDQSAAISTLPTDVFSRRDCGNLPFVPLSLKQQLLWTIPPR